MITFEITEHNIDLNFRKATKEKTNIVEAIVRDINVNDFVEDIPHPHHWRQCEVTWYGIRLFTAICAFTHWDQCEIFGHFYDEDWQALAGTVG